LEWLDQLPQQYRFACLSLGTGDDHPTRFFTYLTGALQTVQPDVGRELTTAAQFPPPESAAEMLAHELMAPSRPVILVLDDDHVLTMPAINQVMAFLFEHMPPHMHLAVIGRSDPPFSLSRLRIRRRLTEIRTRDLRFTGDEAKGFLNQTMGLDLAPEVLANQSEAVQLFLLVSRHDVSLQHAVRSGRQGGQALARYPGDERIQCPGHESGS